MATFYSIVYANIRPSVGERVSIALLLRDENRLLFHYAPDKVDVLRMLLPAEAFSLVRMLIRNLSDYIANPSPVNQHHNYKLAFEPSGSPTFENRFLDHGYVSYLATYSNNLLTFSEPKPIDLPVTDEAFVRLFQKYVHQDWEAIRRKPNRSNVAERIRRDFYPKVKGKVNLDPTLTAEYVPCLITPTRVNIAGRNEVNMIGQVIDFEKGHLPTLEADINRLLALIKAFEAGGESQGKYFVIGREPALTLPAQRNIWQNVRRSADFEFVPEAEIERIDEYIEVHHVQPLIPEESALSA